MGVNKLLLTVLIIVTIRFFYQNKYTVDTFSTKHLGHLNHNRQMQGGSVSNPCTDKLTDIEYLEHMIPHHQVAIDMSNLLVPHTRNPTMLHICRNITRKQSYEIWEMTMMKQKLSNTMTIRTNGSHDNMPTSLDVYNPIMSKSKDGSCNPLFFKPNEHSKHMKHMKITDKSYLEHMIPHHQVAIDMSKRLLLHTTHSYLLDFCRKLIIDQQSEIYTMNNLLKNKFNYTSELLVSEVPKYRI
jgi:uncharacterized protein (DUF305 family)